MKEKKYFWPTNHDDKKSLKKNRMLKALPILESQVIEAAGLGVVTRINVKFVDSVKDTLERSDCKLYEIVNEWQKGLSETVYSHDGKAVIEETRVVLDLPTLALKLKKKWSKSYQCLCFNISKFQKSYLQGSHS